MEEEFLRILNDTTYPVDFVSSPLNNIPNHIEINMDFNIDNKPYSCEIPLIDAIIEFQENPFILKFVTEYNAYECKIYEDSEEIFFKSLHVEEWIDPYSNISTSRLPKNCLVTKMVIKKNTIDDFEDVLDYYDNLELENENLYYPSIEYSDPEILLIYPFRKYIPCY